MDIFYLFGKIKQNINLKSAFIIPGKIIIFLNLFIIFNSIVISGETGKIAGTVKDRKTGEPLIGVNVVVLGTNLGASTDLEGRFYILRVLPGGYELEASLIGYGKVRVKNVKVQIDLTTEVNIRMESAAVEAPTVIVTAEQKMVQKDITSTRRTVTRENIQGTPGLENTADIFKIQAGAILINTPQVIRMADGTNLQVRDESVKDVHIRGGRGGEILYMVDGMPVTHPIYGGRSVIDLNKDEVENIVLLTGGFSAEYGQAQSGVVEITTRSGGEKFQVGAEYKTDNFKVFGESYNTDYASLYLGGPGFLSKDLLPALNIELPGQLSYFISCNGNFTNTPYNNNRHRENISLLGLKIKEKQENTGNFNAKINYDMSNFRFSLSYHGTWLKWSGFDWNWLYYPNNMSIYSRTNQNINFTINHILSRSTYYKLSFGYLSVAYNGSLDNRNPSNFWKTTYDSVNKKTYWISTIMAPFSNPLTFFYDSLGVENIWRDDFTKTYTFKGDFTSQIHPEHLVKTGIELKFNDLKYIDIQDGGTKLSNYGEYILMGRGDPVKPPPGPYNEFGQNRWVFYSKPLIGGAYIQDKFEKEFLIINAGVRLDWFTLGSSVMDKDWKEQWEQATGFNSDWKSIKYKISPRVGLSFPISERTVVFFSYGHFYQLPELQYYYRDPYSGGFTGNPKLDYEQTILYEFGLTHQLLDDWAIDIKSYAKDISKQVGTTHLKAALGIPVDLYDNNGYSRARGVEFKLSKRFADFTSADLTYTIQWADGYSSSAFDDYVRSINDFPYPIRERRLNWDVRHQVIFEGTLASTKDDHINIFGLELPNNWNLTMLSSLSSGQPYTPWTSDPAEAQKTENNATGPIISSTDLKFIKAFDVVGLKLSLVIDIFNIFNQKNTQISYGFNAMTGKPYKYGDIIPPSKQYYPWYEMYHLMDPRQFSTGRTAKLGLRIDF